MISTKDKVVLFLDTLRNTHPDFEHIYRHGCCFELYKLLRIVFPNAEPWYDFIEGHIYTKIDKFFYDIRGKHVKISEHSSKIDLDKKLFLDAFSWNRRMCKHMRIFNKEN